MLYFRKRNNEYGHEYRQQQKNLFVWAVDKCIEILQSSTYNAIWFQKPNVRHKKYQMTQWTQIVPKNASTWNATFLSFNVFK